MNKKLVSVLLTVATVSSLIFTGCGQAKVETEKQAAGATEGKTEAAADEAGKTVVTFQTWNPSDTGPESAI